MRNCICLLAALVVGVGPALGQDKNVTPPRLRISTKLEKQAKSASADSMGLMVEAVSPGGLGQQFGLQPGDVIRGIEVKVGDKDLFTRVATPQDLTRGLFDIRTATFTTDRTAKVKLTVLKRDEKEQDIVGTVIRTEFPDRADGGTLYYFRNDKKDNPPRAPDKKPR